jgi:hypothetical protein
MNPILSSPWVKSLDFENSISSSVSTTELRFDINDPGGKKNARGEFCDLGVSPAVADLDT